VRYLNPFLQLISILFLLLALFSCDPEKCRDGQLLIDFGDNTPPVPFFEVTTLSMTPSGPVSSIAWYDDAINSIKMSANDKVTIRFKGKDTESGIGQISQSGGFGYTCENGGGLMIALSGIVPAQDITIVNDPITCGEVEVGLFNYIIDGPNLCPVNFAELLSGGYAITGEVTNNAGLDASSQLMITIVQ